MPLYDDEPTGGFGHIISDKVVGRYVFDIEKAYILSEDGSYVLSWDYQDVKPVRTREDVRLVDSENNRVSELIESHNRVSNFIKGELESSNLVTINTTISSFVDIRLLTGKKK